MAKAGENKYENSSKSELRVLAEGKNEFTTVLKGQLNDEELRGLAKLISKMETI